MTFPEYTPEQLRSLSGPRRERDEDADYDAEVDRAMAREPFEVSEPERGEDGRTMYQRMQQENGR